jgi:hypothetical protein
MRGSAVPWVLFAKSEVGDHLFNMLAEKWELRARHIEITVDIGKHEAPQDTKPIELRKDELISLTVQYRMPGGEIAPIAHRCSLYMRSSEGEQVWVAYDPYGTWSKFGVDYWPQIEATFSGCVVRDKPPATLGLQSWIVQHNNSKHDAMLSELEDLMGSALLKRVLRETPEDIDKNLVLVRAIDWARRENPFIVGELMKAFAKYSSKFCVLITLLELDCMLAMDQGMQGERRSEMYEHVMKADCSADVLVAMLHKALDTQSLRRYCCAQYGFMQ